METVNNYTFSFDSLEILGQFGDTVHVVGNYLQYEYADYVGNFKEPTVDEECILVIKQDMFHDMLQLHLNDKKRYCEKWNHYCGVGGRISCDVDVLETDYQFNGKRTYVFGVTGFEDYTDMEHG